MEKDMRNLVRSLGRFVIYFSLTMGLEEIR